ncbi:hypothetical protein [uncultured Celeribacter sp.]|uniref:hypothetical protein n=1 Tax=uncultured Celeribacter sp. TaxID=1303376 RepID=UPI002AA637AC|nr:hypothetical protein [uncultured Celeribacter sp.]
MVRVLGGVPHPARFLVRGLQDWRRTADTNPLADLGLTLLGLVWLAVDDTTFGAEAQSILGQWGWGKAMLGPGWAHETGEMSATGANLSNTILARLDTADLGSNAAQKARLTALKSYIAAMPIFGTRKETARIWLDHMLRQLDSPAARLDPYLGKLPIQGVTDVDGVLRAGSGDPKIGYHLYDKTAREFTLNLVVGPLSDERGAGMLLPERYLKQAAARGSTKGVSGKARVSSPGAQRLQAIKPLSASVQHLIAARAAPAPSVAQPVLNKDATTDMAQQSVRAAGEPLLKQLIDAAVPEVKGTERKGFKAALTHLAMLPAATLEWHLRETLGLATNRLDAWLTALATERLREVAGPADSDSLAQFGGYGMVLDLKPGPARESEGFLQAPTMAQATTGAILRSAWLGHGREDEDSPLAVDLSSRRLRMVTRLFEGVSQGRDVGEILGQDVERSLHDSQDDVILYDLRQAVLEAGKAGDGRRRDTTVRGPLDGLDLIAAYDAGALTAFLQTLHPVARRQRIISVIETARASFDALGDAGLAEATHYLAQGNMARAGAVLNALSLGEVPPAELRHARTDISKSELEHRVLLALPELTDKVARKGAPGRLLTHPGLDAYVTPMLPDLSTLGVDVISGDTVHRVPLLTMMKELEFSALDLICEAARPGALGRHAMVALIATGEVLLPETHVPTALGAESETGPRVSADLEEFEELAHELSAHLGALRPARPSDFGLWETGEGDMVLGASLVARLKALALRSKTRAEALKTSAEDISRLLPLLSLLSREGLPEALCGPDVIFAQDRTVFAGHLERLGTVLADRARAAEQAAASTEPETWIEALRQLGDTHLAPELPISGVKLPFGATLGFPAR